MSLLIVPSPPGGVYFKHTSMTTSGKRFVQRGSTSQKPVNSTSGVILPSASNVDYDFYDEGLMLLCFHELSDNDLSDPDITYVINEVFWKFKKKNTRLSVDKLRRCVPPVISPTKTQTSDNYSEVYPKEF